MFRIYLQIEQACVLLTNLFLYTKELEKSLRTMTVLQFVQMRYTVQTEGLQD